MNVFVCQICGDAYIGEEAPTHCPFCGAPKKYIVDGKGYSESKVGEVTDVSKNNVLSAIKLEDSNSEFYLCASKSSKNAAMRATFKRLSKVEGEHASVLRKLIGASDDSVAETCGDTDAENVKSAMAREERATAFYSKALSEANEPRVRQVFEALVAVEETHKQLLEKLG